jgi:hypothetical protein
VKKYHNKYIAGVLVIVLVIFALTQISLHQFTLQYLDENKELQTEVFNSTKEFNKRAEELKAEGISYWLN